ncbi:unnamed protein product [Lactuca virosa]|uniref:Uncharacterized protein n=1 Tax=Lactuca virosa TaxID=75947 RepID=A0AAU9N732_9ASTR|nr:unnamed protein product [Lactuca virosa]
MEDGPDGTSSGVIRGTLQQTADTSTQADEASPVARMQNLEGPEATPQVATVVRHQNTVTRKFVSDERTDLQGKTTEEVELDEFEALRKLQSDKRLQKEKEWDRVSVHTDQMEDSSEEEKGVRPLPKKIKRE